MDNIFHIAQTSLSQFLLSRLILRFCKRSQVQSPDPASSARPPQVSSASSVQQGGLTHWEEASPRFTKQSGWNSAPCMHFCQHQLRHSQWKASWTGKEIRAEGEGELGLISRKEQNGRFFPEARTSCDTSQGKLPEGRSIEGFLHFLQEERFEKVDLCEEILQTSKLVKELPASLGYSG